MHYLEQKVLAFLQEYHLTERRLLLGFSGGADSTALCLMLKRIGQNFLAVHFEHGIRGREALQDADWCRSFCRDAAISFECHSLDVPAHCRKGETLEEAARRLRLENWQALAAARNLPVLLAHHHDDCLENFFLRLGRGAGSSGLTGLRKVRRIGNLELYRPMLDIRRQELEEYLRKQGISGWCCDSTNEDVVFRRNAVRHELLPLWRKIFHGDDNLSQTMQVLAGEAEYLETEAERFLQHLEKAADWRNIPDALLPRVLRIWWHQTAGQDRLFNKQDLNGLKQALNRFAGGRKRLMLSGGAELLLTDRGLSLPQETQTVQTRRWNWRRQPCLNLPEIGRKLLASGTRIPGAEYAECFSEAALEEILMIRAWHPGDRMQPFGCPYDKKLQDLWTDARIPAEQRAARPLILCADNIIWVPGLRRAEFGRLSGEDPAVWLALLPA